MSEDLVNHPKHYADQAVDGHEPIELCELFGFCIGNAMKYLIRAGHKDGSSETQDLRKALWYLLRSLESGKARRVQIDHLGRARCRLETFSAGNPLLAGLCIDVVEEEITLQSIGATSRAICARIAELTAAPPETAKTWVQPLAPSDAWPKRFLWPTDIPPVMCSSKEKTE